MVSRTIFIKTNNFRRIRRALLAYVRCGGLALKGLIQEIKVTEHVAHIGKSEIRTKFRQLKGEISPWKFSICGRVIIQLIIMLWH